MNTFIYPHELTGSPKNYMVNKFGMRHIHMSELNVVELKQMVTLYTDMAKDTIKEIKTVLMLRIDTMNAMIKQLSMIIINETISCGDVAMVN